MHRMFWKLNPARLCIWLWGMQILELRLPRRELRLHNCLCSPYPGWSGNALRRWSRKALSHVRLQLRRVLKSVSPVQAHIQSCTDHKDAPFLLASIDHLVPVPAEENANLLLIRVRHYPCPSIHSMVFEETAPSSSCILAENDLPLSGTHLNVISAVPLASVFPSFFLECVPRHSNSITCLFSLFVLWLVQGSHGR